MDHLGAKVLKIPLYLCLDCPGERQIHLENKTLLSSTCTVLFWLISYVKKRKKQPSVLSPRRKALTTAFNP